MKKFFTRIWNKLFSKEKPNRILLFDPGVDRLHQNDDLDTLLREATRITDDQESSPYCHRCQSYHPPYQPHYDELGEPSFNPFSDKFSEIDEAIDRNVVSRLLPYRKHHSNVRLRIR